MNYECRYLVKDSERSEGSIDCTMMCVLFSFFFLILSHVAPRKLLRSLIIDPVSGRKPYTLGVF